MSNVILWKVLKRGKHYKHKVLTGYKHVLCLNGLELTSCWMRFLMENRKKMRQITTGKTKSPVWAQGWQRNEICKQGSGNHLCGHMQAHCVWEKHSPGEVINDLHEWQISREDRMEWHRRCRKGVWSAIHPGLQVIHQETLGSSKGQSRRCSGRQKPARQMLNTIVWMNHLAFLCVSLSDVCEWETRYDMGMSKWPCMWIRIWAKYEESISVCVG